MSDALPISTRIPVALVTGASGGIGSACAVRLATAGFHVALHYHRDSAAAAKLSEAIRLAGGRATPIRADLQHPEEIPRLSETIRRDMGRLDVLVLNAGIAEVASIEQIRPDAWDRMMDLNLRAPFLLVQEFLPLLRENRASVILMASQAGQSGGFFIGVHYSASKGGVLALTKALAKQLAPFHIRVNAVAPGIIDTDMTAAYQPSFVDDLVRQVPLKRIGTADDVAAAVAFLASEDSSYITGATIPVNGGLHMA